MMKRPIMNPSFLDEENKPSPRKKSRWRACLTVLKFVGRIFKVLFADVLRRNKSQIKDEVGTPFSRFLRGLFYRLMFVPTILAVLVSVLVVTATHPKPAPGIMEPTSQGVYYDPVELLSLDNTKLEGWLVPVLDARKVLKEGNDILHKRHAAMVLVHDFGASRQQVLPLVAPLHEAGYVVLAINLRGRGPSASTGCTFGLNEAQDVRAAIDLLRRRPFVDPDAIGMLKIGTGATAALIAAEQDGRVAALVLDHPVKQFDDILNERIGPRQPWLTWVRPMCKWAFEIAYKVDAEDMNLSRFSGLMKNKPVLLLDERGETNSCVNALRSKQVVTFVRKHLVAHPRAVTSLLQREAVGTIRVDETSAPPAPAPAAPAPNSEEQWPPQRPASEMLERAKRTGW
jgi:pimeloyl-ACP methyl ester carboxylesterase